MYAPDQTRRLQQLTKELLEKGSKQTLKATQLKQLKEVILFHEYRYYVMNDPLVADFEYDQLFNELLKLESENEGLSLSDSPSQRVGGAAELCVRALCGGLARGGRKAGPQGQARALGHSASRVGWTDRRLGRRHWCDPACGTPVVL